MKTKKFFAVEVFDNTCNVMGHESGIYGKGDYSWINESLNGGNGEYNMTEGEALEVKADFERIIKERNLEWASVEIDSVDVPVAETMQDVADYYNECDVLDTPALENMIEANGWVSDCATEWGICHNDSEKVIVNDDGEAVVVPMDNGNNTVRLYLINMYESYSAYESGINAVRSLPTQDQYYKYETLEEADVRLPKGFTIEKTNGGGEEIFNGNMAAEIVTVYDELMERYATELVTSDGIVRIHVWNYTK